MSDLNDIAKINDWTEDQLEAVGELLELLEDRVEGVDWAEVVEEVAGKEKGCYPFVRFAFCGRVFSEEIQLLECGGTWVVEVLTGEGDGCFAFDSAETVLWYVAACLADEVKEMNGRLNDRTQGFLRRAAEDQREICRLREMVDEMGGDWTIEPWHYSDDQLIKEFQEDWDIEFEASPKKEGA